MLWAALTMGILGSMHCVGMCGPLALAVTRGRNSRAWLSSGLPYHLGRATTYTMLGVLVGTLGAGVSLMGYQKAFSIGMGVLMLVILVPSLIKRQNRISWKPADRALMQLRKKMGELLQRKEPHVSFNLGILNGLLPCGWVYMAILAATAADSLWQSAGFMALFGLGTFPAMLFISFVGNRIPTQKFIPVSSFLKILTLGLAFYLIFRGWAVDPAIMNAPVDSHSSVICK